LDHPGIWIEVKALMLCEDAFDGEKLCTTLSTDLVESFVIGSS
jgi:hypothetical protein